jgi:hypothetical protein
MLRTLARVNDSPLLTNWMIIGMSKRPRRRKEFEPAAADEEQSYLYLAGLDDAAPAPVVDWRQVYWDYYFRAREAGETPVAEWPLYAISCTVHGMRGFPPMWYRGGKTFWRLPVRDVQTYFLAEAWRGPH